MGSLAADVVLDLFLRFLRGDEDLLDWLREMPGRLMIEGGKWQFTLPGLYRLACIQEPALAAVGYKAFRRKIFNAPLNASLQAEGARISIADNSGKADETVYELAPLDSIGA